MAKRDSTKMSPIERVATERERELFEDVKREMGRNINIELLDSITLSKGVIVIVYQTTYEFDGKNYTSVRAKMKGPGTGAAGIILDSESI